MVYGSHVDQIVAFLQNAWKLKKYLVQPMKVVGSHSGFSMKLGSLWSQLDRMETREVFLWMESVMCHGDTRCSLVWLGPTFPHGVKTEKVYT